MSIKSVMRDDQKEREEEEKKEPETRKQKNRKHLRRNNSPIQTGSGQTDRSPYSLTPSIMQKSRKFLRAVARERKFSN